MLDNTDLEALALIHYEDYDDLQCQLFALLFDVANLYLHHTNSLDDPVNGLAGLIECMEYSNEEL